MTISMPAALAVNNITFRYPGGAPVFREFTFQAREGEFVVLLGPSGCGKSTLLNLLAGFTTAESGSIHVRGEPVRPENAALGYVFQQPQLFGWLTALENVRFGLRMRKRGDRQTQREIARRYLALVGLAHAVDLLPNQMSGGMQQRVALARALALEPQVLLMDEPFAALDAITRSDMNEETLRLWSALGQTTVFITHDIEEAVFLADRVVVLNLAPGGVHSELAIDLPRPRSNVVTRQLPDFLDYRTELLRRIAGVMQVCQPTRNISDGQLC
ncbi:ABC transporter ATP-binding protein [Affinibrenneria salicis]|uniref:ABC transporter ATP-binding protein n=1 Tax=Affinibrenneria salicis TaxID=2590031 RepID=A0A5J5G1S2_9GAMM|nr:ABC transporter ATP-binding protein [Affinibrenneria salicis]KAA9000519.1 ABC transporter ATP-binding protein [Affinibrenneria salicis]